MGYKYHGPVFASSTSMDSSNHGLKLFKKIFFRKFQKAKLKFALHQQPFT